MSALKEKGQELLRARLDALDGLSEAMGQVERARTDLRAAESALTAAMTVAVGAGWTAKELRQLGLPEQMPLKRGVRSRGARPRTGQGARGSDAKPTD